LNLEWSDRCWMHGAECTGSRERDALRRLPGDRDPSSAGWPRGGGEQADQRMGAWAHGRRGGSADGGGPRVRKRPLRHAASRNRPDALL
jgi:hypothetical protein